LQNLFEEDLGQKKLFKKTLKKRLRHMLSSKTGQTQATEVGGWDVLYFVFAKKK
jgi:hypothetical protein